MRRPVYSSSRHSGLPASSHCQSAAIDACFCRPLTRKLYAACRDFSTGKAIPTDITVATGYFRNPGACVCTQNTVGAQPALRASRSPTATACHEITSHIGARFGVYPRADTESISGLGIQRAHGRLARRCPSRASRLSARVATSGKDAGKTIALRLGARA
jgi:hypothetical protein